MTQSTAPPPLDDLLLAALGGGRLARELRQRITELFVWLIKEETTGDRDPAARALADRLMDLYDQTRDPANEVSPAPDAADEAPTLVPSPEDSPPIETVSNDNMLNVAALNDPVLNDTVLNDTVLNEPVLNDAVPNDGVLNDPVPLVVVVDPEPEPAPEPAAATALRSLWDGLRARPAYGRYCDPHGDLPTTNDLDEIRRLWKVLHLVSLKLPHEECERVTSAAQAAVSALPADAVPVPWAGGVSRLAEKLDGVQERLAPRPWADRLPLVERFAWLAANDPAVRLGLQSIATSGELVPLTEDRIRQFNDQAESRLIRVADQKPESPGELEKLVELDELLRGLVPIPLPATDSWWAVELKRWTNVLSTHPQATGVHILPLDIVNFEPLRDQYDLISPRLSWDQTAEYEARSPGRPVWILRYARRNPKLLSRAKGRILIEAKPA